MAWSLNEQTMRSIGSSKLVPSAAARGIVKKQSPYLPQPQQKSQTYALYPDIRRVLSVAESRSHFEPTEIDGTGAMALFVIIIIDLWLPIRREISETACQRLNAPLDWCERAAMELNQSGVRIME